MSRLAFTDEALLQLKAELLAHEDETCAILFGRAVVHEGALSRVVVHAMQWPSPDDYQDRTRIRVELRPDVVAKAAQRSRRTGESIIFVHSHPFPHNAFSAIDDAGEKRLADFLAQRTPGVIHAALLVTPEAFVARILGTETELGVVGVGKQIIWGRAGVGAETQDEHYDRQIRMFGHEGQARLKHVRVGIVGLGGTGTVVLEQLAHLGVEDFLLIDPDRVESTNLNRLVGANPADVGRPKVDVARDLVSRINPRANVETVIGSILLDRYAKRLAEVDFIFSCTDSHGSRAVLNQLAYQYLVPMIDMGVVIAASQKKITHVIGRTQMLAPGLGCLLCGNLLSPEAIRVDLLTDFERQADPYVVGFREPAPAVISLNSTMSSLAVTMFLGAVVGIPSAARLLNYDAMVGTLRRAMITPLSTCIVCSNEGALAQATAWPLPARLS